MDLAASDSIIAYYKKNMQLQQGVIDLQDKKFKEQAIFYEEEIKRKNKKSRKKSIGVGVGGTLLGFVLGVLLSR